MTGRPGPATGRAGVTEGIPTLVADQVSGATGVREWIDAHAVRLHELVLRHGAVRVSGLPVQGPHDLAAARAGLGARPAYAREHFAPREALAEGVYTPPSWEAAREMCPHHEQSYEVEVPRLLLLGCVSAPASGGAALLYDSRALISAVPAGVVARLREQGWQLLRTFHPYFGLPWSQAYGIADAVALEQFCAARAVVARWERGGVLRTVQRRPALVRHPVTGDECWFNDLTFLSLWSVEPAERAVLRQAFGTGGVPLNTSYGDGQELDEEAYRAIQLAYQGLTHRMSWSDGDLLVVDNFLTGYGREPYTGAPEIIHALADPVPHRLAVQ